MFQKGPPSEVLYLLFFQGAKQCSDFEGKIRKLELSIEHKQCEVLCLRRLILGKYGIYCVMERLSRAKVAETRARALRRRS